MAVTTAVISVYFGKPPKYFPLTLKSMGANPEIDFFLFGDIGSSEVIPKNVRFIKKTMSELKESLEQKLGFAVSLESPYKLCDFKPAYGVLFEEYLQGYDYWGMCDLDLVFGDLQPAIASWQASGYDRIFKRGHFMLIRNAPRNNWMFSETGKLRYPYREVYSQPYNYLFDERGYNHLWSNSGLQQHDDYIVADIFPHRKVFQLSPTHGRFNSSRQYFIWKNGKLSQVMKINGEWKVHEWAYMHMQKRKIEFLGLLSGEAGYVFFPNHILGVDDEVLFKEQYLQQTGYQVSRDFGLTAKRCYLWALNRMGRKMRYEVAGEKMD